MLLAAVDQYVPPAVVDINYVTKGVHFNGSTYLRRSSGLSGQGTVTKCVWSMWTKLSAANDGIFGDPDTFYLVNGATGSGGNNYFNMNVGAGFSYFDTVNSGGPGQTITSTGWLGMICSVDLSGAGIGQIYQRDTDVQGYDDSDVSGPDTIPPTTNFYFGQDGYGVYATGDIADFRLWTGVSINLDSINNRRLFVRANGKPADPSLANAVLGTPIVSFIGTVASPVSTFPVNGGSGGSFTTTGTLTAASTSPTD